MKIALAVALFSTLVVAPVYAHQSGHEIPPATATDVVMLEEDITLQNIKPSVMVSWLQPMGEYVSAFPRPVIQQTIEIPATVKSIVASDSTNSLSVKGGMEGLEKLRELISALDKPIPQIEISARWLSLLDQRHRAFFDTLPQTVEEIERADLQKLESLIASKKVNVVSAPRVTTFNGANAQLIKSSSSGDFYHELQNEDGSPKGYVPAFFQEKVSVKPLLKNALISLDIRLFHGFDEPNINKMLPILPNGAEIVGGRAESNVTIGQEFGGEYEIEDGQTIALSGFSRDLKSRSKVDRLLVLITARQIHHIDNPLK